MFLQLLKSLHNLSFKVECSKSERHSHSINAQLSCHSKYRLSNYFYLELHNQRTLCHSNISFYFVNIIIRVEYMGMSLFEILMKNREKCCKHQCMHFYWGATISKMIQIELERLYNIVACITTR